MAVAVSALLDGQQVDHVDALRVAAVLGDLVGPQSVDLAAAREEEQVVVRVGDEEVVRRSRPALLRKPMIPRPPRPCRR